MQFEVPIYRDFKIKGKIETKLIGLNWYRNEHFQSLNKVKKEYFWRIKEQYKFGLILSRYAAYETYTVRYLPYVILKGTVA
jgi:hypothetical protein